MNVWLYFWINQIIQTPISLEEEEQGFAHQGIMLFMDTSFQLACMYCFQNLALFALARCIFVSVGDFSSFSISSLPLKLVGAGVTSTDGLDGPNSTWCRRLPNLKRCMGLFWQKGFRHETLPPIFSVNCIFTVILQHLDRGHSFPYNITTYWALSFESS